MDHKFYMKSCVLLGFLVVSLMAVGAVHADSITVPNYSFETPDASGGYAPPDAADWVGQFSGMVVPSVLTTIVPWDLTTIAPLDGVQTGYLNSLMGSGTPRAYITQALETTYEAGKSYTLTTGIAIAQNTFSPCGPGQSILIALGYWEGDPPTGNDQGDLIPTIVASRHVTFEELSTTAWADFSTTTDSISGGAVGKAIAIWIGAPDDAPADVNGIYYVDNVRCSSVPEPSTITILLCGVVGLLAYAWRKR